jgi:hypothetical protein
MKSTVNSTIVNEKHEIVGEQHMTIQKRGLSFVSAKEIYTMHPDLEELFRYSLDRL